MRHRDLKPTNLFRLRQLSLAPVLCVALCLLGCGVVFDSVAQDVELLDERRELSSLWRVPDVRGSWSLGPSVVRLESYPGYREGKVYGTPAPDPASSLLPLVRGVDGQLYWPMLTNDFVHPSLHVYRMPAGVQVMQLDANGVEKLSPGRYLLWTTPRSVEPMHEGKVTYVELGSAPIEVPIPVQNNNVSHAGDGAIISYDSQATPRRLQLVRFMPPNQLLSVTLDWPPGTGMERRFALSSFFYDGHNQALIYKDEAGHLWVDPVDANAGAPMDLGHAEPISFGNDGMLYYDDRNLIFFYSVRTRNNIALGVSTSELKASSNLTLTPSFLVSCSPMGLRSLPLQQNVGPAALRMLDARYCLYIIDADDQRVHYVSGRDDQTLSSGLDSIDDSTGNPNLVERIAKTDGSAPYEDVPSWDPVSALSLTLARCGNELRAYSLNLIQTNPKVGDGWVNGWRFSDAAYEVAFSNDCRRVRWKQYHGATGVGEILSAEIGSDTRLRLARNADRFAELPDGRVVLRANINGDLSAVRLLLIDEEARQAHWLLSGPIYVVYAELLEPLSELLLGVSEDADLSSLYAPDYWVRMPVPPRALRN